MRVNWQAAAMAAIVLMAATTAQAVPCALSTLGWMVGHWKAASGGSVSHEQWVFGPSGELIGLTWGPNRRHSGDVVRLAAISAKQGTLVLRQRFFDGASIHASEDKDDPVTLKATSCAAASITFEGIGRWAGGHVTYSSAAGVLKVEGEARDNGSAGHFVVVLGKE